ncbi:MAG: phage tail tape measure protein [Porcipelethomonas sp.]
MPSLKTVFALEDKMSAALSSIGNTGNNILSELERASQGVDTVMNKTSVSISKAAGSLSQLSGSGAGVVSQSRQIADVMADEAQKMQTLAARYRTKADNLSSAADFSRKFADSLKTELEQTDNLTDAMKENAAAALDEAYRLESAASAAEEKAQKAEKAAQAASRTAEAAVRAAAAEESFSDSAEKAAEGNDKLNDSLKHSESEFDDYGNAARNAGKDSGDFGDKSKSAVEDLKSVLTGAGIAMALREIGQEFMNCSNAAAEFETGIAKISTIADTSQISIGAISSDISALSSETGQSVNGLSEAAYQAMSASVDTESAVEFVEKANQLAVGGFTQQATAADVLTTAINAYGLEVSETTRISDMLIETQNLGKTTVDELAQSMGRVIPLASAYNVGMDNLSAAYAEMTKNGIATAESTTYIKSMLNELGDTSSEISEVLTEETGKSFAQLMQEGNSLGDVLQIIGQSIDGDATAFNNLWSSQEAGIGALSLFNSGAEAFNSTLEQMKDSAGATSKAYETMTSTTEFASKRMTNSFSNLEIAIGKQLNPIMESFYDTSADILDSAAGFVEENPAVVAAVSAVATGIGALTVAVGGFVFVTKVAVPAVQSLTAVMNANPVFAVVSAVAAVTAGVAAFTAVIGENKETVEDYNGTLEECHSEISRTEAAYEKACGMYGENSSAAQELRDQLETLNAQYEKGGGAVAEYAESAKNAAEKINELAESEKSAMEELDATNTSGYIAVSMLESLSDKANLTNTDLELMSTYANYLNDTFNCNIVVDYDTGELTGFDPKIIAEKINSMYKEKKITIAMEAISDVDFTDNYKATSDAYVNAAKEYQNTLDKYQKDAEAAYKDYLDACDDYADENGSMSSMMDAREKWQEYQKPIDDAKSSLDECKLSLEEADTKLKENCDIIDESGELYQMVKENITETSDVLAGLGDTAEETLSAEEEGIQAAESKLSGMSDEILNLCEAYDEAYNSALESFQGQFGLFDEANANADATVEKAQTALDSQLSYWNQYSENISFLADTSAESLGITQENYDALMSYVKSGDEQAAGLAQSMVENIKHGNSESVAALAETIGEVESKQTEIANTTAEWTTDFDRKLQEYVDSATNKINNDLNLKAVARANGVNTVSAYADAISEHKDDAVASAQSVVDAVRAVFDNSNITYSVSESESSSSPSVSVKGNAYGTTNAEEAFVAGEEGPELILDKGGATVFPASETNKIVSAVYDTYGSQERQIIRDHAPLRIPEPSDTYSAVPQSSSKREISLDINGKGSINISGGMSKEEVVSILYDYLRPVLMDIISSEVFEEGVDSYEF